MSHKYDASFKHVRKCKTVMVSPSAFHGYCHVQLLVLKAFLNDLERFRLGQCSAVHLFSDCFTTDLMSGKWGHNLVVTCIVCFKSHTLL